MKSSRVFAAARCAAVAALLFSLLLVSPSSLAQGVESHSQAGADIELAPVPVKASADSDPIAKRARTGTKTETLLIETPQAISVITREQLDMRNVKNATEALRYSAGVTTQPYGADPRYDWLFIRGFTSTTLGNYRDGLRQITPACCFGVYRIDGFEMERVEILKGPSSVLYGQNSPGGIVNRVSKHPDANALQEIKVEAGSFARRQLGVDVGGAGNEFIYRLIGVYRDSGTQFRDAKDNRRSISPSFTWQPSDATKLTVLLNYLEDLNGSGFTFTYPGTATKPPRATTVGLGEKNYNGFNHRQSSYGYEFEHRFSDAITFRQSARHSDINVDYRTMGVGSILSNGLVQRGATRVLEVQKENIIDNQLTFAFATGELLHTLLVGADYLDVTLDNQTLAGLTGAPFDVLHPDYGSAVTWPTAPRTKAHQTQKQIGIYLQDQIKFDEHWLLTVGGRRDKANNRVEDFISKKNTDQDDNAFTGRAGLTYLIGNGWAPYISYSESFLPTVGNDYDGDAFKPTRGKQYEVGLKVQPVGTHVLITAALFDLNLENALTADPNHTGFNVQTGEVHSRGLELEATMNFDNGVDLIAAYTYTDVTKTKTNIANQLDKRPTLIPRNSASLWSNYTIRGGALSGLGFGAGLRYTGESAVDAANVFENASTTVADATVFYDWQNWRYSVNVNNIFNREFANCNGASTCSWGAERTIDGSVRYRW